jgi:hypothetical protein
MIEAQSYRRGISQVLQEHIEIQVKTGKDQEDRLGEPLGMTELLLYGCHL